MLTPPHTQPEPAATDSAALRPLIIASATLTLLFALPLFNLARFALQSSLYSHIVLIPFISLYLARQRRSAEPDHTPPNRPLALAFFSLGLVALAVWALPTLSGNTFDREDSLTLTTFSFLGFFAALCAWLLGRQTLHRQLFPLAFLLFMLPMPVALESAIETVLQHGSAAVAQALFGLAGTTVFVDGLIFQLTNITLRIAPECSGIHSSLALLITSILAGSLFLRSPVRRTLLALAVFPLALFRNGFRVFVLGELCVHISPDMINSYIHHNGGPIFFVLSLIPFALLLILLVRTERQPSPKP